jgi:hypothetical protein
MAPGAKETNAAQFACPSGAPRLPRRDDTRFDQQSSPFPEYDEKMAKAIKKRWLELTPLIQMRGRGDVVVDFKLNEEGRVTDVQVRPTRLLGFAVEICRQAILDCAPFDPWPTEMRRSIAGDNRQVTFTFNYHYSTNGAPSVPVSPR